MWTGVELLLKQMARILAQNTNYAALISAPQYHRNKLKFIQLSKVDDGKLLVVIVVEGNMIKNTMIPISQQLSDEGLLNLNILLNNALNGLTIEEINLDVISRLKGIKCGFKNTSCPDQLSTALEEVLNK